MESTTLWVGMDVHKEFIVVSVLESDREVARPSVKIPNEPTKLKRFFGRLKAEGEVRSCYEAGPCGYEVRRLLDAMRVSCDVIAPGLIPIRPGYRVKTDRIDAEKLARLFRAGELTSIRVPTEAEEALRELCRCREHVREDVTRQRHRVLKLLLRHGHTYRDGRHWTQKHWSWIETQRFAQPLTQTAFTEYRTQLESTLERLKALDQEISAVAEREPYKAQVARLRCLRGFDTLSAVTLLAEVSDFRRFNHPRELMAFVGLVVSEHSSAGKIRRGGITKTGNAHARRLFVEAAWHYRHPPRKSGTIKARWKDQPDAVVAHAYKAQERLHRRYFRLISRGKLSQVAAVAVARELCGFVWAIARA